MGRGASLAAGLAVGAALAGGLAGGALAAGEDESELGQHVASCAQIHLGQRENPPTGPRRIIRVCVRPTACEDSSMPGLR